MFTLTIKLEDKGKHHNKNKSPNLFYNTAFYDEELLV